MQKHRGLRHDQIRLEEVGSSTGPSVGIDTPIQIWEGKVLARVIDVQRVARFILPGLEVHRFGRTDAQQDAENFEVADLLCERWIQASAALLDESEVETSGESDGLEVNGEAAILVQDEIGVADRNRGMLSLGEIWDGIFELAAEIG